MSSSDPILTTPLHQMHLDADAKMVPFAGYEMPLQYPLGIKKEHLHTRENAGLFDVSHMGQIKRDKAKKYAFCCEGLALGSFIVGSNCVPVYHAPKRL